MKLTLLAALLASLLVVQLVPAESQRHYNRGRGRSNNGGNAARGLLRLGVAAAVVGGSFGLGYLAGRGKRDVSADEEGLSASAVFLALEGMDARRCMEVWVCDITARDQDQLAEEELDIAALFEEETAEEGAPGFVYFQAAERGWRADGDRSLCRIPSCDAEPEILLRRLQAAEDARSSLEEQA